MEVEEEDCGSSQDHFCFSDISTNPGTTEALNAETILQDPAPSTSGMAALSSRNFRVNKVTHGTLRNHRKLLRLNRKPNVKYWMTLEKLGDHAGVMRNYASKKHYYEKSFHGTTIGPNEATHFKAHSTPIEEFYKNTLATSSNASASSEIATQLAREITTINEEAPSKSVSSNQEITFEMAMSNRERTIFNCGMLSIKTKEQQLKRSSYKHALKAKRFHEKAESLRAIISRVKAICMATSPQLMENSVSEEATLMLKNCHI